MDHRCRLDCSVAHDGITFHDYSSGHRIDYALYPALVAFGMMEVALGGYYSIRDQVIHRSGYGGAAQIDPGKKTLGVYAHAGIGRTIHIIGPVDCSLGIFLRIEPAEGRTYFGARAGVAIGL